MALVNGSFEVPAATPARAANASPPTEGIGWSSTDSLGQIETTNAPTAGAGSWYAEINANSDGTLFQDLPTTAGQTVRWSLAHRGRGSATVPDVMRVRIGAAVGSPVANTVVTGLVDQTPDAAVSADISDTNIAWRRYTGTYVVPSGQTTTRFGFGAVSSAPLTVGGVPSNSVGNYVDSVVLSSPGLACADTTSAGVSTPRTIPVLANDVGDGLRLTAVGTPGHGVAVITGTNVVYTPTTAYTGPDSFTYTLADSFGTASTATVTVTVAPIPSAPAPVPLVTTGEATAVQTITPDGAFVHLLNDSGVEVSSVEIADTGTYAIDSATNELSFTPMEGFFGEAPSVTYHVADAWGQGASSTYTATVTEPVPTPEPTEPDPEPTLPPVIDPEPKPLPEINRSHWIKIPANPEAFKGKERKTKVYNSASNGADAYPIYRLGNRLLVKGQAATLSGKGLFAFDKSKLTKAARAQIKDVVSNLGDAEKVRCEGYADYAGKRSHEMKLSRQRAKAVCAALKKYGAEVSTTTRGFGPKRPAVVGGTAMGRRENRRVVMFVTG